MKITLNWLRDFVDIHLSVGELAERLTMAGIEVESVEERAPVWTGVEVAEILDIGRHPNADRLQVCRVRRASGEAVVVCGARNMQAGDRVALAVPGTALPGGRHIERTTIRGQQSEGMLCSGAELEISDPGTDGILILPFDAPLGRPLADYAKAVDTVLELSVTPNRGDCLSVLGIAREVSALTGVPVRRSEVALAEGEGRVARLARVDVEAPDLCPRYCARVVQGVRIGPSPLWLRTRLEMVGQRPISNVVDATNYVMLERGQPLHAFDLQGVAGGRVTVRRAATPQPYTTLDGVVRTLVPDDLVIADARGPVAIAGIMGGSGSEIGTDTVDVLLESAFFVPHTVRRTARRLGLVTESSYRFERGVDPSGTADALDRVGALIVETAGGSVARGRLERRAPAKRRASIPVRTARVNDLLGTSLDTDGMVDALRSLGAEVRGPVAGRLRVVPPAHRFDLEGEVDVVEEIARLAGYGSVAATLPAIRGEGIGHGTRHGIEASVREAARAAGFTEMVSLAMVASADNAAFPGLPTTGQEPVRLVNAPSVEAAEMRRSLLPGLLRALEDNRRQGELLVAGFCLGRVYGRDGDRYTEGRRLGLLLAGVWPPPEVGGRERPCGFTDVKGAIDLLCDRLHLPAVRWDPIGEVAPYLHPGKSARLTVCGQLCGVVGALHPDLVVARGLDTEPWLAELDTEKLVEYCPRRVTFQSLPRFPAVLRDVAVVVDTGFEARQVIDAVHDAAPPLVEEVRVFDHYTGSPVPDGKKSLAYTISYRAADRTLTDEEVNVLHEQIVADLLRRLPVEVRR